MTYRRPSTLRGRPTRPRFRSLTVMPRWLRRPCVASCRIVAANRDDLESWTCDGLRKHASNRFQYHLHDSPIPNTETRFMYRLRLAQPSGSMDRISSNAAETLWAAPGPSPCAVWIANTPTPSTICLVDRSPSRRNPKSLVQPARRVTMGFNSCLFQPERVVAYNSPSPTQTLPSNAPAA